MADQSNRGYRGPAYGDQQPHAAASPAGDPLAELARLIGGQNDPFAAPSRNGRQDAANWTPDPYAHADPRMAAAHTDYPEPLPPSAEAAHAGYDGSYGGRREPPQSQYSAPPPAYPGQQGQPQGYSGQNYPGQGYPGQSYPGQGFPDPFYRGEAGHEDFEDEMPARRRGGALTVMAVIALALIGTAAAFGYRAVFGGSNSAPPPVIKADTTPAKIVPAATPNDQSKQIYDRVGERPSAERVVSREEKPVDINESLKNPRIVGGASAAVTPPPSAAGLPANASALQSASSQDAGGPKRVRTVTIRPEGGDAESPVATAARTATAAPPPPPAPIPARVASATPQDVAPPPAPVATARPVSTRAPVHHAAAAPDPNAPMSLAPPPAGGAAPARTVRTTSVSSSARASAAPAPSAASASGGGSGYTVQVSSQRSEAEAQSAFRSLQSKYPGQLGGQQPIIRRADLGDKGVFYRVQVGPFGSSDQASELCSNLKNAGGACVVQRN